MAEAVAVITAWSEELCRRLQAELCIVSPAAAPSGRPASEAHLKWQAWAAADAARLCLDAADPGGVDLAGGAFELCLAPTADRDAFRHACVRARGGALALAVPPCYLAATVWELRATPVRVAVAVGGASGEELATVKRFAVAEALRLGADEIELVPAMAVASSATAGEVAELAGLWALCREAGATLKLTLPFATGEAACIQWAALGRAAGVPWLKLLAGPGGAPPSPGSARLAAAWYGDLPANRHGEVPAALAAQLDPPAALPPRMVGVCWRAFGSRAA